MSNISVIINTFNEERNIRNCLECVKWADEIIVVDMYSDDRTVEIARKYTDNIFMHERIGYADPARQFALVLLLARKSAAYPPSTYEELL